MSKYITLVEGDLVCNIPKGMTNWEVLKSIFPYAEIVGGDETLTAVRIDSEQKVGTPIALYTEWLNAPYEKEGE